jgi:thymidine kinase
MLKIYLGPMYSGKTTELIRNFNRFRKYKQLIIDYDIENTNTKKQKTSLELESNLYYYHDNLCNHNKEQIECLKLNNINILEEFYIQNSDIIKDIKYIHINEAQFFTDLKQVVINLLEKYNINIYIYGLDGDFKRNKFGEVIDLIPYCDSIIKLKGVCNNCDNNALFSHRICKGDQQMLFNDSGEDKYIPLCRQCYIKVNM